MFTPASPAQRGGRRISPFPGWLPSRHVPPREEWPATAGAPGSSPGGALQTAIARAAGETPSATHPHGTGTPASGRHRGPEGWERRSSDRHRGRTAGETPSATHPHGTHVRNAGFRPAPQPARAAKPRTALHPHGADPREGRLRSLLTPRQTPDARVAAGFHAREEPRSGNRGDSPHPPDRPRKGVRDRGRRARPASSGWCGAPR